MRMPWSKSKAGQLDLLEALTAEPDAQPHADMVAEPAVGWTPVNSAREPQAHATADVPPSTHRLKPAPIGAPLMVPIDLLDEDPKNPRTEHSAREIDELAQDITERGILQAIVVSAADADGRYLIRFGSQRWHAAKQAGLTEVPVTVATRTYDAYDQVAENLKRHALSPLDLARFIRARIDAGESNAFVAKRLRIDLTTVAHHLALVALPPVLDAVMKSGRCTSPRTLYELSKLHAHQPVPVADLMASGEPITRDVVAALRDVSPNDTAGLRDMVSKPPRRDQTAKLFVRANGLCERLDFALLRLSKAGFMAVPRDDLATLRQRVAELVHRLAS